MRSLENKTDLRPNPQIDKVFKVEDALLDNNKRLNIKLLHG